MIVFLFILYLYTIYASLTSKNDRLVALGCFLLIPFVLGICKAFFDRFQQRKRRKILAETPFQREERIQLESKREMRRKRIKICLTGVLCWFPFTLIIAELLRKMRLNHYSFYVSSAISFVMILAVVVIILGRLNKEKSSSYDTSNISITDYMDGHDFEEWCAELLRNNGFKDVDVTPKSGDQGVDIIAYLNGEKYAIQCKRFTGKLGNKPVQEVVAGRTYYDCDKAAVMTNSYFTQGAYDLADCNDVILWDRDSLITMATYSK